MNTIYVTNYIQLNLIQFSNCKELHYLIHNNINWLMPFVDWVRFEEKDNLQQTEDFIKYSINQYLENKSATYVIKYKNILVGIVTAMDINLRAQSIEIGYWIDNIHANCGIMKNSVKALINEWHKTYNINRFVIKTTTVNINSQKLAKSLGFSFEGELKRAERIGDKWYNQYIYSLITTNI